MYISYVLSALLLGGLTLLVWLVTRWLIEWILAGAGVVFLLFIPAIFRYSRILWLHFDRWIEPED